MRRSSRHEQPQPGLPCGHDHACAAKAGSVEPSTMTSVSRIHSPALAEQAPAHLRTCRDPAHLRTCAPCAPTYASGPPGNDCVVRCVNISRLSRSTFPSNVSASDRSASSAAVRATRGAGCSRFAGSIGSQNCTSRVDEAAGGHEILERVGMQRPRVRDVAHVAFEEREPARDVDGLEHDRARPARSTRCA